MLRELAPNLWITERPQRFLGFEMGTRMTVIRLRSGDLFLHSPVRLDPELRKQLDALIVRLTTTEGFRPDQIVVLTPHSLQNSALSGATSLGDLPLVDLGERRSSALTHATIGAFKGLESDVLILVDVDPADPRCDRNARYVAAAT